MLQVARIALSQTSSYHVSGMLDDGLTIDAVVTARGFAGTVSSHGVTWHAIAVGGRLYFRGASMWRKSISSTTAASFGQNWVRVRQLGAGFGWAGHLADLPHEIVTEVFRDKPGLVNKGVRLVRGVRVVHLVDSTDVYDVRLAAPHVPITWLEPDDIGPDGKPCGILLDHFGVTQPLDEPRTTLSY